MLMFPSVLRCVFRLLRCVVVCVRGVVVVLIGCVVVLCYVGAALFRSRAVPFLCMCYVRCV